MANKSLWSSADVPWGTVVKKAILYIVGTIVSTFGMSLVLLNALGTSAMSTFFSAVANTFDWQVGTMFTIFNSVFLLIGFLAAREYMGIGSVLMICIQGAFLNVWTVFFEGYPTLFTDTYSRILVAAVGFLTSQIGISLATSMQLGTAGFEACLFRLADKIVVEYKYLKIISEVGFFAVSIIFHGVFGVMTLVEVALGGPCFSSFTVFFNKTLLKWLHITDRRNEMYRNSRKYRRLRQEAEQNATAKANT